MYMLERNENKYLNKQKKMYTNIHSSTIHNSPTVGGKKNQESFNRKKWIHKIWYIHTMEYYSVIERNKVLIYATISVY